LLKSNRVDQKWTEAAQQGAEAAERRNGAAVGATVPEA